MHVTHCVSYPERDCRQGRAGACRRCPYNRLVRATPEEKLESLVNSWVHCVSYSPERINTCPAEFMGLPLRAAVLERLEAVLSPEPIPALNDAQTSTPRPFRGPA